ncbi:uncharacterized protein LOC117673572 isoform X2 [Pantherophis guttatus]|uniref:Uncharacterized protein LOC117673572 isoform X2 n=1 Tax=Pantherophis guttatus TaxID=94885 RepID=A0A6P9CUK9_PANGU|nr:uncharacterized protein LOC117673572 isoform X2 [Pantherophis guttatus]
MAAPQSVTSRRLAGSDQKDARVPPSLASSHSGQISFTSSPSPAREGNSTIPPMFMTAVAQIQARSQALLRAAIASERAKLWPKAIEYYRRLLSCLSQRNFPIQYVPGPTCKLLVFETYYHIGVAFQSMHNHQEALEEFSFALETAHIPKNVCQVGCASGSFYQIPVLARRAYSYVKCGKIKEAIRDSTRAVNLDSSNPDVYCIRALVWSSAKEKRRALVDLNASFKLNSSHICTLILRGAILSSLGSLPSEKNKDHEKALVLSWDSKDFCDVEDFYHPKMLSFYDKFLWSLNAFHTITEINLFDGATYAANSNITRDVGQSKKSFRCGSLATYSDNTSLERRKVYTEAVRQSSIGLNGKKDLSSSLTWGFEDEESKSYEANGTRKYSKKPSKPVDWVL